MRVDRVLNTIILTYMTVNSLSEKFDVIVVGGGGAGLMAAYSAGRAGAKVLLVEKNQEVGGTTGLSVGTICATSTRLQKEAGISDNPDSHFVDMEKFMGERKDRDNPVLRRILVDEVPETIRLLEELGVTFMGPLPEPPHSQPRLHAVLPHSRSFIRHLTRACQRHGVKFLTGAVVDDLLVEGGRVQGIALAGAPGGQDRKLVRARRGVILATGDFSSSALEYKRKYMSGPLLEIGGINPASTGDGQRIKLRTSGAWAEIAPMLGASTVVLPGSEVFSALERKVVDAIEWGGPGGNLQEGFNKIAKYVMMPGLHAPSGAHDCIFNKNAWAKIGDKDKALLEVAGKATMFETYLGYAKLDIEAYKKMHESKNNEFVTPDKSLVEAVGKASKEWAEKQSASNEWFKKVYEDQAAFVSSVKSIGEFRFALGSR